MLPARESDKEGKRVQVYEEQSVCLFSFSMEVWPKEGVFVKTNHGG